MIKAFCLSVAVLAACREFPDGAKAGGRLEATWSPRDGGIAGEATAEWCALRQVLEIRTIRGDTGLAIAVYPGKAVGPGRYRVVDPVRAESLPPAAAVAVRWVTRNRVQGFRGDSGQVELERSPSGQFYGRVRARARSVVDTERISLTASFRDLTPSPDSLGCSPPDTADENAEPGDTGLPSDTGIH